MATVYSQGLLDSSVAILPSLSLSRLQVYGEATLLVPLLIAETFAQRVKLPHKTEEIVK